MKEHIDINTIQELTKIFHESNDAMVNGIRGCLKNKGVEPKSVIVAEWFPDDVDFEFGIIVDASKKVFQFGYDYSEKNKGEGVFSEWNNLTSCWKQEPLCESVAFVLENYEKIL